MIQDDLNRFDESINRTANGIFGGNTANNQLPNQDNRGISGLGEINSRESGVVELPYSFLYKTDSDSFKIPMDRSRIKDVPTFKSNMINFLNKLGAFTITDNNPQSVDFFVNYANNSTIPDSIDQNGNKVYNTFSYHVYCALDSNDLANAVSGINPQPNEATVLLTMCVADPETRFKLNSRKIQLLDYETFGDINDTIDRKRQARSIIAVGSSFRSLILAAIRDSQTIQCTSVQNNRLQGQINQAIYGITGSVTQLADNVTSAINNRNSNTNQYNNQYNPYSIADNSQYQEQNQGQLSQSDYGYGYNNYNNTNNQGQNF